MKILLTGATGFLGQNIYYKFSKNHLIDTIGRSKSTINIDLAVNEPILNDLYDIVIHAAGKAHSFTKTDGDKKRFFDVNVTGTLNLLKALEKSIKPRSFIFISSVAVYGNENGILIDENNAVLATDPYGKSKIDAEKIILNWCSVNNVMCTILRLPLIAGPNPPGNLKTMINGIKKGYYFDIAGGKAKKSIVLAEDIANIIPIVAKIGGVYNLTDRQHPSFSELSKLISIQLGKSKPVNMPIWIASILAKIGDLLGPNAPINSNKLIKITSDLTFDDTKAQKILGWKPTPVLRGFKIK